MEICHDLTKAARKPSAVALGCFDGLHLGHRQVIDGASRNGMGLVPAVFTFEKSSLREIKGRDASSITTSRQTLMLLEEYGIRTVYMVPFSLVHHITAEDFVKEVLLEICRAKKVYCGFNFHFGEGAAAGTRELRELCSRYGAETVVIPPVEVDGALVSATRIREFIRQGEMEKAAVLLGRRFGFDFPVIHGRELGRRLGAPTINQPLPEGFVLPRFGVYASVVTLPQGRFSGVTNVGIKPTVGSEQPLAETWIDGYDGRLYGQNVHVELLSFIRPEQKFSGMEALKAAIARDGETAKAIAGPYL